MESAAADAEDQIPTVRDRTRVLNSSGVHARPSSLIVTSAWGYQADVRIESQGRAANGKSILDVLRLGGVYGSPLEIHARGEDAAAALARIKEVIDAEFFATDCCDRLVGYVRRTAESDPVILTRILGCGDVSRDEPNDLYYWHTRGLPRLSPSQIASYLRKQLSSPLAVRDSRGKDEAWMLSEQDLEVAYAASEQGTRTIAVVREGYEILHFSRGDLDIFANGVVSTLRAFSS